MPRSRGRRPGRGGSGQGRGRRAQISRTGASHNEDSDIEQSPQPQDERVNPPENQGSALKKKKGKRKTPTALVVIEVNDTIADYLFKESNFYVIQRLYEMTRQSKLLIFFSTKDDVIEKLDSKFENTVEIQLFDGSLTKERQKEQIMELIMEYTDDRIVPETSVYIGNLFTKKDMLHTNYFRFGTICSNVDDLFTLFDAPPANDEENNNNHLLHNLSSPAKGFDMEIELKKTEEVLDELKEEIQIKDEMSNSAEKTPQNTSELYISKLKSLSAKISSKLAHKFDEIKPKMLAFDLNNARIPNLQPSENSLLSKEERQMLEHRERNFDDVIFAQLKKGSIDKDENPLIVSELSSNLNQDVAAQIKDLKFEVINEMDSQPILKKLKSAAEIKNHSSSLS